MQANTCCGRSVHDSQGVWVCKIIRPDTCCCTGGCCRVHPNAWALLLHVPGVLLGHHHVHLPRPVPRVPHPQPGSGSDPRLRSAAFPCSYACCLANAISMVVSLSHEYLHLFLCCHPLPSGCLLAVSPSGFSGLCSVELAVGHLQRLHAALPQRARPPLPSAHACSCCPVQLPGIVRRG